MLLTLLASLLVQGQTVTAPRETAVIPAPRAAPPLAHENLTIVLLEDPVYPGVWVEARPVGVLYMRDEAGEDAKLICVAPKEPRWADVDDLDDLSAALRAEIQHFFEVYKALEPDKHSSALGMAGCEAAWREIEEARANYS